MKVEIFGKRESEEEEVDQEEEDVPEKQRGPNNMDKARTMVMTIP